MPWRHDAPAGGFTSGEPWLPVPPEHLSMAVDLQADDPASPLERVAAFLAWRRGEPVLATGAIAFLDAEEPVLAFTRTGADGAGLLCAFNLGDGRAVLAPAEGAPPSAEAPGVAGGTAEAGRIVLAPFGAFIGRFGE
jgi:alpha-glucosidase